MRSKGRALPSGLPVTAGGDPDLPAADTRRRRAGQPSPGPGPTRAGEPPRDPAGMAPGRTDPPPPGPPADEWCTICTYKLTAPGHAEHVRGAARGVPAARNRPQRPRPARPRRCPPRSVTAPGGRADSAA